ncbi:hypothetical protein C8R46DRAFT_1123764 [Mycena filopes]|nr:hypothetical protein C8R46DRAFT_1123764 [Mycena filopes]
MCFFLLMPGVVLPCLACLLTSVTAVFAHGPEGLSNDSPLPSIRRIVWCRPVRLGSGSLPLLRYFFFNGISSTPCAQESRPHSASHPKIPHSRSSQDMMLFAFSFTSRTASMPARPPTVLRHIVRRLMNADSAVRCTTFPRLNHPPQYGHPICSGSPSLATTRLPLGYYPSPGKLLAWVQANTPYKYVRATGLSNQSKPCPREAPERSFCGWFACTWFRFCDLLVFSRT